MKTSTKNSILFLEILLWYRLLTVFVPAVAEYSPFIINALVVLGIYMALFFLAGVSFVIKTFFQFIPLYIITIANTLWGYRSSNLPMFLYGLMQWSLWPIAISFIQKNQYAKEASRLYLVSLILILFTSLTTYFGNVSFPGASRELAAIWAEESDRAHYYRTLNIGGFDFVYLLVLLIPIWIYSIRNEARFIPRVFIIASVIIAFLTIHITQYTTALIISILSLVLFLTPRTLSTRTLFIYLISGTVIFLLSTSFIASLISKYAATTDNHIVAERMAGVSDILMGKSIEGDAESRQYLLTKSWESFKNNPLSGSRDVGGHSFILDAMGHYGIWGIMFLVLVFWGVFRLTIKPYKKETYYGYLLFSYISQIVLAFLNTTIIFEYFFIIVPLASLSSGFRKPQVSRAYGLKIGH